MGKKIKETKCTCLACGNVWFYGKREWNNNRPDVFTDSHRCLCCCFPSIFKDVKDLNKCDKCNSSAVKKEEITHEVQ